MRIQLQNAERYLARKIIYEGREYGLSTIEIAADGIMVRPFEKETPATVYVDGVIIVEKCDSGLVLMQEV